MHGYHLTKTINVDRVWKLGRAQQSETSDFLLETNSQGISPQVTLSYFLWKLIGDFLMPLVSKDYIPGLVTGHNKKYHSPYRLQHSRVPPRNSTSKTKM